MKILRRLAEKRGTDGELPIIETLAEVLTTWFLEHYFRYRDAASAVVHYSVEGPSPQGGDPGLPATSSDYNIDGEGKVKWDFADLDAAEKPLEHTVLRTNFT